MAKDETVGPIKGVTAKREVSGIDLAMDNQLKFLRQQQKAQDKALKETLSEKMVESVVDAVPLITGLGLLKATDSPLLALGGAYFSDKLKDAVAEKRARVKKEKDEIRQRRMAARILVERKKLAGEQLDEATVMQQIEENRLKQAEDNLEEEQTQLLREMGLIDDKEKSEDTEKEAVDKRKENADKEAELLAQKENSLLNPQDTSAQFERGDIGDMDRAQMTEHLRNISDTAKEALGIQVSGKDRAITDSQGMLQSNVAMRDLLEQHLDNLEEMNTNIDRQADIANKDSIKAGIDRQRQLEAQREAARSGCDSAAGAGPTGKQKVDKGGKGGGGRGGKIGGLVGKLFGGLGRGLGALISGFIMALGNPMMIKAAAIFAIVMPMIGVGLGGFVAAFGKLASFGIDAIAKTMPALANGLKTLEALDGNKLSAAASSFGDVGYGLGELSLATLFTGDASKGAEGLPKLSSALKTFEELNPEQLSKVGPAMGALGKGLAGGGIGAFISQLADPTQLVSLAGAVDKFANLNGDNLAKVGPAMNQLGQGLKSAGIAGFISGITEKLGMDPSAIFTNVVNGINKFAVIDVDRLVKIAPAMESLGKGMKDFAGAGMTEVWSGLAKSFMGLFTKERDPIQEIRKFEVLGSPETSAALTAAGNNISIFGKAMNEIKGLVDLESMNLEKMDENVMEPLGKMAERFGKLPPHTATSILRTIRSLHQLQGLEKLGYAEIGTGMPKLGAGFDEFADYLDDGEPKDIEEASKAIAHFAEAIQKGNMAARLAGPAGDQAEAGAAVQGASQGIQIMNMQGNFTLEDASIVKIVQGMASAVPGGGSTTVNNQTVQSSGSMQIRAGNASTLAKKSYLNRRGF